MANATSSRDIINAALQHAGELTNGESELHELAIRYVNKVYKNVLADSNLFNIDVGEPWDWARAREPRSLILQPKFQEGTVSLTNGSNTGTFSTPPADSQKDRYLKVNERPTFYKIISHTGGSGSFTIDVNYIEVTGAALGYKTIPLIYDLGDGILKLAEPFRVYTSQDNNFFLEDDTFEGKIFSVDIRTLRKEWPLRIVREGTPIRFAILHRSETEWLVQFNAYPSKQVKIDYDFVPQPKDLIYSSEDVPLMPREYRDVLVYGAASFLLSDKEDDKATQFFQLAGQEVKKMLKGDKRQITHTSLNKGKLIPRQDQIRRGRRIFLN